MGAREHMEQASAGSTVRQQDQIVVRLQELRRRAGEPSYAEIARLVGALRVERGLEPSAALPPRSTVYDAFRLGRRRLDRELVADLTAVLEGEVARLATFEPAPEAEPPDAARVETVVELVSRPTAGTVARVLLGAVFLNFLGQALMTQLSMPIWLDMAGTCLAAIVLGPWWGVAVASTSTVIGGVVTHPEAFAFAPVPVAGALLWGYGVRRWGGGRTPARFFALTVAVALLCSAVSVPITVLMFGGEADHGSADVVGRLLGQVQSTVLAVTGANLVVSVMDKLLSGFIALAVVDALAKRWPWLERVVRG